MPFIDEDGPVINLEAHLKEQRFLKAAKDYVRQRELIDEPEEGWIDREKRAEDAHEEMVRLYYVWLSEAQ